MPAETDIERAAMLDVDAFGVAARLFPAAGGSVDLNVVFDDPYLRAELGLSAVSSRVLVATALESAIDAALSVSGDEIEIPAGGARYRIKNIRRRQGFADLELDET